MPIVYQYLTDRTLVTQSAVTTDTLIHVVIPSDVSQNPDGSSYKAKLSQVIDSFSSDFVHTSGDTMTGTLIAPTISATTYQNLPTFTGNTSANCITDLYVTNLNSCSPLHIQPVNSGNVFISEGGGTVGIGTTSVDGTAPETLTLSAKSTTSYNIITAKSNVNNYTQLNIINKSNGTSSSADIVATNNTGNETTNFIDMGINGSNFSGTIGVGNDAYMYSTGRELYVGNASTGSTGNLRLFAGNNGVSPQIFISGTTGYVGIGNVLPKEKLHVSGNTIVTGYLGLNNNNNPQYVLDAIGTQSRMYYDSESVGGRILLSGNTNVPRIGVAIPPYLTKPVAGFDVGMRAWNDATYPGYGKVGDAFFYAGNETNGFNFLNPPGTGTEDYIRFYAGQTANGTTPDIYIQGSGVTRGYVGVGTSVPTQKLHVSGNTIISSGLTASTLNISSTPTTDTGTTLNYLTRDGSTGEVKVKTIPGPTSYGLFTQTGNSVAVSATTVESTLINNGIGTITVPANGFQVGDSFNGVLIGHLSCVGTATLQIRIKTTTGVLFADTGAIAMNAATNKHWKLDVNFTIRQLGVASVGSIASGGLFSYTKNSGTNFEGVNFSIINDTTFDTTISNTLLVTAEWNTNNAGNSIYSEIFTLNKIY